MVYVFVALFLLLLVKTVLYTLYITTDRCRKASERTGRSGSKPDQQT